MRESLDARVENTPFYLRYHYLIVPVTLGVITLAIYSQTFGYPFHFDDNTYIVNNPFIRDLANFWPPAGARYLGFLSFALNFRFWGLDAEAYRLTNIIIHIANGCLVYQLALLIFRATGEGDGRAGGGARLAHAAALSVSVIFVTHPVQTQAVIYISQRFTSLSTLFYLLSLVLYIKCRDASSWHRPFFYILSLASATIAQTAKEISFTLPFVLMIFEAFFPVRPGGGLRRRALLLAPFLLVLLIIPLSVLAPESMTHDTNWVGENLRKHFVRDFTSISPYSYFVTQFKVIALIYLRLMVLPVRQNFDYAYPLSSSFLEPQVALSFLLIVVILSFAIYLALRGKKAGEGASLIASFGIIWFFVTLSVESSVIPIKDAVFEHRLYLPGIGLIIAFSSSFFHWISRIRWRGGLRFQFVHAVALLLVTALPLGVASYLRGRVWKDNISLYEDVVKKSPMNARAHNNLGNSYSLEGRLNDAVNEYRTAARLDPRYPAPRYNLGKTYAELGLPAEAVGEYRAALDLDPGNIEARYELGNAYYMLGLAREAVSEYVEAISAWADYTDAHYMLGRGYLAIGEVEKAVGALEKALFLDPAHIGARLAMGDAHMRAGRWGDAVYEYKSAALLDPSDKRAYLRLADAYHREGRLDEALSYYRKYLETGPQGDEGERLIVKKAIERILSRTRGAPGG